MGRGMLIMCDRGGRRSRVKNNEGGSVCAVGFCGWGVTCGYGVEGCGIVGRVLCMAYMWYRVEAGGHNSCSVCVEALWLCVIEWEAGGVLKLMQ